MRPYHQLSRCLADGVEVALGRMPGTRVANEPRCYEQPRLNPRRPKDGVSSYPQCRAGVETLCWRRRGQATPDMTLDLESSGNGVKTLQTLMLLAKHLVPLSNCCNPLRPESVVEKIEAKSEIGEHQLYLLAT